MSYVIALFSRALSTREIAACLGILACVAPCILGKKQHQQKEQGCCCCFLGAELKHRICLGRIVQRFLSPKAHTLTHEKD